MAEQLNKYFQSVFLEEDINDFLEMGANQEYIQMEEWKKISSS